MLTTEPAEGELAFYASLIFKVPFSTSWSFIDWSTANNLDEKNTPQNTWTKKKQWKHL